MKFTFFVCYVLFTLLFARDLITNEVYVDEFSQVNNMYFYNSTNGTLKNISIVFDNLDRSVLVVNPIEIDSLSPNQNKQLIPTVLVPNNLQNRNYMVEAIITADDFKQRQIISFRTTGKNGNFKWIGLAIASLTALLFFIIFKRYT